MDETTPRSEDREFPHWNRVYIAVVIFTVCLIAGLWRFSRAFM